MNLCPRLGIAAALVLFTGAWLRAQSIYETPYTFTTLAGQAGFGVADGTGDEARFHTPKGMVADASGNFYVADSNNHTIRKVSSGGVVTTLAGSPGVAGSADGTGSAARFNTPTGLALGGADIIYVADSANHTIRKIIISTKEVTTLAGSAGSAGSTDDTGSNARFDTPTGVAVDSGGNLFVADSKNYTIRQIASGAVVSTFAGTADTSGTDDGTGSAARFTSPSGVAVDGSDNVYVADTDKNTIRKITSDGVVTTLAGLAFAQGGDSDGTGTSARFRQPASVSVDSSGNVYVADTNNHTIRMITSSGVVTTLAGSAVNFGSVDGIGSAARFSSPCGVMVDSSDNLYVADSNNHTIRLISSGGVVTTLVGSAGYGLADGIGTLARFTYPGGVAVDSAGTLYVVDYNNHTIRKITRGGVVTTLAGTAGMSGSINGTGSEARFNHPAGVAVDNAGNLLYVADSGNHTIRQITVSTGEVVTLAGTAGSVGADDGTGSAALFDSPYGVAVAGDGTVYVADKKNNTIRQITSGGVVTTLAGTAGLMGSDDGSGSAARFFEPISVTVDTSGNLYVADHVNHTIRKIIISTGEVTTLAGSASFPEGDSDGVGSAARFNLPAGVAVDASGNLYVAELGNHTIRKLVISSGEVTTLAGLAGIEPIPGWVDGTGSSARFDNPAALAVDSAGNIYVADGENHAVRWGAFAAPTFTGTTTANGTFGQSFTYTSTFTNILGSYTASGLPAGLSIDNATGVISGTPAAAGEFPVILGATNGAGTAVETLTLTIAKAAATVTLGSLNTTFNGSAQSATATTTPGGLNVTFTYEGLETVPTNAGNYAVVGTIEDDNYTGSASGMLVISQAAATVSLGSLSAAYDGTPKSASAVTNPGGLAVNFTYDGSETAPTALGSYAVVGTISENNYTGSASGTLVIGQGTATVTLSSLSATYDGTPKSATATTTPSGLTVDLTYAGSPTAPTSAGSYAVIGTINSPNYTGSASGTLVISKATATVNLGSLSATYDGNAKSATATTTPEGLPVGITYDGSTTAPTNSDSYAVVATINHANYQGSASGTLVIGQAAATVTLGNLSAAYDGTPKSATATTNPGGLAVSFTYGGSSTAPTALGSYAVVGTITEDNYTGSAEGTLVISQGTATVTLGSLSAIYNGSPKSATATTTPGGLNVTFTYDGSATAPTNVGSYAVVGTINDLNYTGNASGTLEITKATATVNLGSLSATYDGNAKSATATTTPGDLPVAITYDGSATAPTNADSYAVVATINHANYQGSASGTLVIGQATATVTLGNLSADYDGTPKSATASTNPGGLAVSFTYGGSSTAPTALGSYAVVGTITEDNYTGSAEGTLVIGQGVATVTLGSLNATYNGSPQGVTVTTTPSGLAVSFTYNGSGTAPTAAGDYAVVATVNDVNYAGSANGTLTIAKGTATVALGNLSATYDGNAHSVTATTTPGSLPVDFTYDGSATAPTNAGSYAVVGTINHANYQGSASGTLVIGKGTATVTLGSLSATYSGNAQGATATTSPVGLAVDFTYDGLVTAPTNAGSYAVAGTINDSNYAGSASGTLVIEKAAATVTLGSLSATYNGSAKSATATTTPGSLTVDFTYNGSATAPTNAGNYTVVGTVNNANYLGSATGSLVIDKATASVALGSLSATYNGSPKSATATTNPVSLPVDFTYDGSPTAPTNAGSYAVVGTINHTNYQGSASGTLIIGKATATVTLGSLSATYNGSPKSATATTNPVSLPVDFTYDGSPTAPTNAGSYAVIGTVNHANYQGSASGTLVIGKATATVSLGSLSATYNGSPKSASATTTPIGLTVGFTYDGSATAPTNAGSYAVIGTVSDANYQGSVNGILEIAKATQAITFGALPTVPFGTLPLTLSATASSSLAVTFTVQTGPAMVSGNSLTLTGAGSVTVRASQPGDDNFEAAADEDQTFAVTGNYDSWLLAHFTESELLNPAISGPNADPDKDGFNNLMEYALALEPKAPSTTGLPEVSNSATHWLYTFTRPTDRMDVTYTVQYSTNLTIWTAVAVGDVSQIGSTASTVTIQARQPMTTANVFFRLKVTQP